MDFPRARACCTATRKRWDTAWRPELVRDKDGISAAVLIAELAAAAKADGKTIFDTLDELYLVHGLHASDQLSIRVADLGLLDAMMNRLRVSPPESFGGSAVEAFGTWPKAAGTLPPTDGLLYLTKDLSRVIIRPSGTEPKLKCYLEVIRQRGIRGRTARGAAGGPGSARRRAAGRPRGAGALALGLCTPVIPGGLELNLDEAVNDAGAERGEAQVRGAEAFAGFQVVDLFVQRRGDGRAGSA